MVDIEPKVANPARASTTGDAPLSEPVDAAQPAKTGNEKKDDTQVSPEPMLPPANEASSSEKPASSQPSAEPAADSQKGKEKEQATAENPSTDTPPALPTKEDSDSLSIEPSVPATQSDNPICNITLLLPTGARHPYKIDERYLTKRSVDVPDTTEAGKKDPFSISVYTLKELILREWREEWNDKPASPSSIRLIHFGKLLDDKEQLKSESRLSFRQVKHGGDG
jgi:hypothetical protein